MDRAQQLGRVSASSSAWLPARMLSRLSVMFLSDGNAREDEFAIVEVPGLTTPVIVPVRALTLRESGSPTAAGIRES